MLKTYVAWSADAVAPELEARVQSDDANSLRRLQQQIDHADKVWRSWAEANGGSVLTCGRGEGVLEISPSNLKDLPALQRQYGQSLSSDVAIGVGTTLSETERALRAAKLRGPDTVLLYGPHVDEALEANEKGDDPLMDLLHESNLDESPVQKAIPGQNPHAGGGGFGGFSQGAGAAAPAAPVQEASEHSQAEGLRSTIAGAEEGAPPAPEMTHAGQDLEDQFHALAGAQDQKDAAGTEDSQKSREAIKAAIVSVLQRVRGQTKALGQLKQGAPEAYQAVMSLVQGVIAMAHSLEEQAPLKKSEVLEKMGAMNRLFPVNPKVDVDKKAQVPTRDWQDVHLEEDRAAIPRIDGNVRARALHSLAGKTQVRVNESGQREFLLHRGMGADEAAKTIGETHVASDRRSSWTPTLGGKGAFYGATSHNQAAGGTAASAWVNENDIVSVPRQLGKLGYSKYPSATTGEYNHQGPNEYKDEEEVIVEAGHKSQRHLHKDSTPVEEEHLRSIVGKQAAPVDLSKGKLPMPEVKTRTQLELPVGTVKQGGPTGNAHGEVGKIKVSHGDGKTTWISARAGQVTAVADRHAQPVLGQASHPLSSRNPAGH